MHSDRTISEGLAGRDERADELGVGGRPHMEKNVSYRVRSDGTADLGTDTGGGGGAGVVGNGRGSARFRASIYCVGLRDVGAQTKRRLRKLQKSSRRFRALGARSTKSTLGCSGGSRGSETLSVVDESSSLLPTPFETDLATKTEEDGQEKGKQDEDGMQVTLSALRDIIFGKIISVLLIFLPFAWASYQFGWSPVTVFWLNFLAMIPLASILGDFTEEVAAHTNQVIGGLINATFGNAVEVVVAIQALLANEIRVVQASMIGSIFSNLLLVLGGCFFFGGLKHKEQEFNSTAATANMSLLALSSLALVLPTPFAEYYDVQDEDVLTISRIVAVFLIFMYLQLLIFQLRTHVDLFQDEDEEEAEVPFWTAMGGLVAVTLLIAKLSDYLVESIDGFCEESGVSRTFVGLIILPIVGNAVEHITAISVATKDKMDLAMGVAVGSCTQISLFVIPITVIVGWFAEKDMTLNFPHFEIILFILSVVIVSICISNPRSNWLEGSLLMTTYLMIAVGFWFEKVTTYNTAPSKSTEL